MKGVVTTRRQARECALQLLFELDLNPGLDREESILRFWQNQYIMSKNWDNNERDVMAMGKPNKPLEDQVVSAKMRAFTEARVRGVLDHLQEIDTALETYTSNWEVYRLGTVERNVLRLAYYELAYCPDVPAPVVLNEAIDLAKYFNNSEAGRFVNGVLDKLRIELQKKQNAEQTSTTTTTTQSV